MEKEASQKGDENQKVILPVMAADRISIGPLTDTDDLFMLELLNTPGWQKFIGDRNVRSPEEARKYIKAMNDSTTVTYRTVRLLNSGLAIGVVTLIKRSYAEYKDIGFAFLPQFSKQGYAREACETVIRYLQENKLEPRLLAEIQPGNDDSIKLIRSLDFSFLKEITVADKTLHVYERIL